MRATSKSSIVVLFNRDFEGAEADPENRAREDIRNVADGVIDALVSNGFSVTPIGVTRDVQTAVAEVVKAAPIVAFNLCESLHGDNRFESLLPMLLELAGVPYTGTGPLGLALALHKDRAKDTLRARRICTPEAMVFRSSADLVGDVLPFPLIVKPSREDASVGISAASVVHDRAALVAQVTLLLDRYRQPVIAEQFIEGREIYVSMLQKPDGGIQILPLHEIDFAAMPADRPRIVSFEGKWVEDSVDYKGTRSVACGGLDAQTESALHQTAAATFAALDLRDYGRVDFRVTADGTPFVIDVNPNCDLSTIAGFARAARAAGMSYETLILRLLDLALLRRPHGNTISLASRSKNPGTVAGADDGESIPAGRGGLRVGAS